MGPKAQKGRKQKVITITKIFTCSVCEKSFPNQYKLERHSFNHVKVDRKKEKEVNYDDPVIAMMIEKVLSTGKKRSDGHSCELCGATFRCKLLFSLHLAKVEGIRPFKCTICERRFNDHKTLTDHIRTHSENEGPKTLLDSKRADSLTCKFCLKQFTKKVYLTDHLNTHYDRKPYKCPICSKGFSQRGNCAWHVRMHKRLIHHIDGSTSLSEGDRFQCDLCDKSYSQKTKLTEHRTTHFQDISVKCKLCEKVFSCAYSRDRHVRESHEQEKHHKCKTCGKKYSRKIQLSEHIEAVHGKPELYTCNICGKAFSNQPNLKIHYQRVHKFSKPKYCCAICDQGFFHKIEYSKHHKRCVTNAQENDTQKLVFRGFTEDDYFQELEDRGTIISCMCGLSFKDRSLYFIHSSSHSFPDGKQCAFCNYSSTGWFPFFAHMMDHSK